MKELLDLAETLGEKIAETGKYAELRAAEESIEQDPEAKALFDEFIDQNNKMAELEASGGPIEPEDKKKFAAVREDVLKCEKVQDLARRQADFSEVMNKVNDKIRTALKGAAGD